MTTSKISRKRFSFHRAGAALCCTALALSLSACGRKGESAKKSSDGSPQANLSGSVAIDGSSTVYPLAQAAAEQFQQQNPNVKITVGESGTGGGFEKFCNGEIDISNASRPIKSDEEAPICQKNGVKYGEVQVADDGIAVVTNKDLKIDCIKVDELKALWNTKSKVTSYSEINPNFPATKVSLYGPGTQSGTFDFFTEEVNGEKGDSRKDYQPSEDDNVLVEGVSKDKNALGYFGFSYYEQNKDKLNLLAVDGGAGCQKPAIAEIQAGSYKPLARPLFMYPSAKAMQRPEVKAFLQFTVDNYESIAKAAQLVPMTTEQQAKAKAKLAKAESSTS